MEIPLNSSLLSPQMRTTKSMSVKRGADKLSAVCGVTHTQTFDCFDKCITVLPQRCPHHERVPPSCSAATGRCVEKSGCLHRAAHLRSRKTLLHVYDATTRDAVFRGCGEASHLTEKMPA